MRILGILAILFGLVGLWYNGLTVFSASRIELDPETPYFVSVFRALSATFIAYYIGLLVTGVQLIRTRPAWLLVLSGILALEIFTFFAISAMWLFPVRAVAMSVGAATGVSAGGIVPQLFTLFPIWGVIWACITYWRMVSRS